MWPLGAGQGDDAVAMHPRPHGILLIIIPELGWGDLGCYSPDKNPLPGGHPIPTPHLDRMAAEGARWTDWHAPSSYHVSTRYAIETGRWCWRTPFKRAVLPPLHAPLIEPGRATLASLAAQAGRQTACFGLWELGLDWQHDDTGATNASAACVTRAGYQQSLIVPGLSGVPLGFWRDGRCSASAFVPRVPVTAGECKNPQRLPMVAVDLEPSEVDTRIASAAATWVAERTTAPWFANVTLSGARGPSRPPLAQAGRSRAGWRGDQLAWCDDLVGRILDALPRPDDTLVLVTSDGGARPGDALGEAEGLARLAGRTMPDFAGCQVHRDPWGGQWLTYGHRANGPWSGYRYDIWEGGHRVPCLVRWPARIPAGSVRSDLACLSDLCASLAALDGVALPPGTTEDSEDVALAGGTACRQALVVCSHEGTFAIRHGDLKLIDGLGGGDFSWPERRDRAANTPYRLFDLKADPGEHDNIAWSQDGDERALYALLDRWRDSGRSRGG